MNQSEIRQTLEAVYNECSNVAVKVPEATFFQNFNGKWSIGENLIHLSKGAKGFNKVLKMPKEMIQSTFGIANHTSKNYAGITESYNTAIKNGGVSTSPFVAQYTEGDTLDDTITRFKLQHDDMLKNLDFFTESELDTLQVPHPLLGNLTLREMFEFMILHIRHHQKAIEKIVSNYQLQSL